MIDTIDELLESSIIDNSEQSNVSFKEVANDEKPTNISSQDVIDANILVKEKEEIQNISQTIPEVYPKNEVKNSNIDYENKVADLSGAFDSVVEKKRQLSHTNTVDQKIKKSNKKKTIYIVLIIVIWSVIIFSIVSASIINNKKKELQAKRIQELQLKKQQHVKVQTK